MFTTRFLAIFTTLGVLSAASLPAQAAVMTITSKGGITFDTHNTTSLVGKEFVVTTVYDTTSTPNVDNLPFNRRFASKHRADLTTFTIGGVALTTANVAPAPYVKGAVIELFDDTSERDTVRQTSFGILGASDQSAAFNQSILFYTLLFSTLSKTDSITHFPDLLAIATQAIIEIAVPNVGSGSIRGDVALFSASVAPVPLPGASALVLPGLAGPAIARRRA